MALPDPDPVTLLGRAVADERVAAYLRSHGETRPFNVFVGGETEVYGDGFGLNGFSLSANAASVYEREVGTPRSRRSGAANEMIVHVITFSDAGCAVPGSNAYPHPLPFGLRFGDPAEIVTRKLGAKPQLRIESGTLPDDSPLRFTWFYRRGDLVVQAGLTQGLTLAVVCLRARELWERPAKSASLAAKSNDIDPANAATVEAQRATFPIMRWRGTMADGGELFTEAIIARAEALLDRYVDSVKSATAQRSAPKVHAATKRLVMGLNKLNAGTGWIETLERDELGELIDRIVRATGLELPDGEDITLPLREW